MQLLSESHTDSVSVDLVVNSKNVHGVHVVAVGRNPCFVVRKKNDVKQLQELECGNKHQLVDGDILSLLVDFYPFELHITDAAKQTH